MKRRSPTVPRRQGKNSSKLEKASRSKVETSEMFDLATVAPWLKWHQGSAARACRQGRIVAVKVGNEWRVSAETLEDILKNGIPAPEKLVAE